MFPLPDCSYHPGTEPRSGPSQNAHDSPEPDTQRAKYLNVSRKVSQLLSAEALGSMNHLPDVEENAGPAREALRPRFREAWQRFVEEETR